MKWILQLMDPGKLSSLALGRMKPEERLSKEVADNCRAWTLDGVLNAVWFHVPNELAGGTRHARIRYAVTKHMGLIPGSSDYVFVGLYQTVLIELKTKTGKQTINQSNFEEWCDKAGVKYYVCRSMDEVRTVLIDNELLRL